MATTGDRHSHRGRRGHRAACGRARRCGRGGAARRLRGAGGASRAHRGHASRRRRGAEEACQLDCVPVCLHAELYRSREATCHQIWGRGGSRAPLGWAPRSAMAGCARRGGGTAACAGWRRRVGWEAALIGCAAELGSRRRGGERKDGGWASG